VAFAVTLARRHDAILTGLFAEGPRETHISDAFAWPNEDHVARASLAKSAFTAEAALLRDRATFIDNNGVYPHESRARAIFFAIQFDLIILGHCEKIDGLVLDLNKYDLLRIGRQVLTVS